jgi:hypothetical protein
MRIPTGIAKLLSSYQNALFYNPVGTKNERVYIFYLLVRPLLLWSKKAFKDLGFEKDEVESEFYLLAEKLFVGFKPDKSSIVPYLEKHIPWKIKSRLDYINKYNIYNNKIDNSYIDIYTIYNIDILFQNRFEGKLFTAAEKYVISKILSSDDDSLSVSDIAKELNVNRKTIYKYYETIAEKLSQKEFEYASIER